MLRKGTLEGIKVLDLSQFLSGPRCTQLLADAGAEVIKIEPPGGEVTRFLVMLIPGSDRILSILNRNKKCITLDLRKEEARSVFKQMVERADVLVENFKPGTMEKMGIGYDVLKKINPRIVYGSVTGFGQYGPHSQRGAFDIIAQATGGMMDANKQWESPPVTFLADLVSGAYLALGIMMALFYREKKWNRADG
jgi:formyl-CoA transferase